MDDHAASILLYLLLMKSGTAYLSNLKTFLYRLRYFRNLLKKLVFNLTIETIS